MNSAGIRQLRRKFVIIAMMAFTLVILFTGGTTALTSQVSLREQAGSILEVLVQNEGTLPKPADERDEGAEAASGALRLFEELSAEFAYGARYFSVRYDNHGSIRGVDVSHVASVDERQAVDYANAAVESYDKSLTVSLLDLGMTDTFFYKVAHLPDGGTIAAFLDCSFQMRANREAFWRTVLVCGVEIVGGLVLVLLLSKHAIRPEIENARRQKQFITNASHELKTPLAVIRANTELLQMLQGENEWTRSTMSQVDRMDGLVQNLVMIARAEEREDRTSMSQIDVGKAVVDSVEPFQALARQEELELVCNVGEDVRMVADESAIRQLCTLLVDNAIKYCDPGGSVFVEVTQPTRGRVVLEVRNTFASGKKAQFSHYFERFWRDDESHSDEGGYGIGLSVAESICKRYGGIIKAGWKGGMAVFTCSLRSA